jgi:hypothetical protein
MKNTLQPSRHRLYWIWGAMVQRCTNPKNASYQRYGGKGVGVCDRWKRFANFYADMGMPPAGHVLDRIDNFKGYSPDNCRWLPTELSNNNRRICHQVEVNGTRMTMKGMGEALRQGPRLQGVC